MTQISVIIPVYNTSEYLDDCLKSCINQTFQDIEILCVNDGSTDNSLEIINKYAKNDKRIIVIDKENEGQGKARNTALEKASGKYVIFPDSDDFLEENALQILHDKMEKENSDVCFFNAYYFYSTGEKVKNNYIQAYGSLRGKPFSPKDASNILFQTNALPFKIYNRNFLVKNNIKYSNHRFAEDFLLYFNALTKADLISTESEYLYNYRIRSTSLSHTLGKNYKDEFEVFYLTEKDFEKEDIKIYLNSFLINRATAIFYWYKKTNKKYKNAYYKEMKKCFRYITEKYGTEFLKGNSLSKRFASISRGIIFEEFFFKLGLTIKMILNGL